MYILIGDLLADLIQFALYYFVLQVFLGPSGNFIQLFVLVEFDPHQFIVRAETLVDESDLSSQETSKGFHHLCRLLGPDGEFG